MYSSIVYNCMSRAKLFMIISPESWGLEGCLITQNVPHYVLLLQPYNVTHVMFFSLQVHVLVNPLLRTHSGVNLVW